MKKHAVIGKYFKLQILILLFFIAQLAPAQIISINFPATVCANQTYTATVNSTYSAPLTYQWAGSPGVISNLNAQGSQVAITFTTCGTKTINCTGYDTNNNAVPGASAMQVIFVPCQPPATLIFMSYSVCQGYSTTISSIGAGVTGYTWLPGGSGQPTLSATAGNYTLITSTSPYGCLNSTVVTVGLAPPLNLFVTSNSPSTCVTNNQPLDMKPVTLIAVGATSYSWTPFIAGQMTYPLDPETTVKPRVSTCYTVTGLTAVCSGTAQICVNVTPQFSIDVVPVNPLICSGNTVAFVVTSVAGGQALPSYTYTWAEDPNVATSIISVLSNTMNALPLNSSTYTTEVINAQNCMSSPKITTVNVAICTELNDLHPNAKSIRIYPNPANGEFFISSGVTGGMSIDIINVLGECMSSEKFLIHTDSEKRVDVSHLQKGIYFIKLEYNQITELVRFITN